MHPDEILAQAMRAARFCPSPPRPIKVSPPEPIAIPQPRDSLAHIAAPPRVKQVIVAVARHFSVKPSDILGDRRLKRFTIPRQIACYLLRNNLGKSLSLIGKWLNRDHTSVLHACRVIERQLDAHRRHLDAIRAVL